MKIYVKGGYAGYVIIMICMYSLRMWIFKKYINKAEAGWEFDDNDG